MNEHKTSSLSQAYVKHISGVYQVVFDIISSNYFRQSSCISQAYISCISGKSKVHFRHRSEISQIISQTHPRYIVAISPVYHLWHISGMYQVIWQTYVRYFWRRSLPIHRFVRPPPCLPVSSSKTENITPQFIPTSPPLFIQLTLSKVFPS